MSAPTNDPAIVSLPKTAARRGAHAYVILVERVSLDKTLPEGMAYQGRMFRPGTAISLESLYDAAPDSKCPLVLEYTEVEDLRGARKHWRLLLILWRFEIKTKAWVEIGRVLPPNSYEAFELRELAARVLQQDQWRKLESLSDSAKRIGAFLQVELAQLGEREAPVLELVMHHLIGRIVERAGSYDVRRKPAAQQTLPFSQRQAQN